MHIEAITACVQQWLYPMQNSDLTRQVTSRDVWQVVKSLHPTKSPRADGYMGSFFQQYWDVIGEDVTGMVMSFFLSGRLHITFNHTHLA